MKKSILFCFVSVSILTSVLYGVDNNKNFKQGEIYQYGKNNTKIDLTKALTYYAKGCSDGSYVSCYSAGEMYYFGRGVPVDYKAVIKYTKDACMKDDIVEACQILGTSYGKVGDKKNAITALSKACTMSKNIIVCDELYMLEN